MAPHVRCLRNLCRLCGHDRAIIEGRCPVSKEKVSKLISAAFDVRVEEDQPDKHPPFICKLCQMKLKQWWEKYGRKNMKSKTCNINLATFTSDSCDSCSQKSVCDDDPVSSLQVYKEKAESCGLLTWIGDGLLQIMKMGPRCIPVCYFTVFTNFTWKLVIAGIEVQHDRLSLELPTQLSLDDCLKVCEALASKQVCEGNSDFREILELKRGPDGECPLYVTPQDEVVGDTIRHKSCRLLVEGGNRCSVCRIHRSDLAGVLHRLRSKSALPVNSTSKRPLSSMTYSMLKQKTCTLQKERKQLKRKLCQMQNKIEDMIQAEGMEVEPGMNSALIETVTSNNNRMKEMLPEESAARLMWEQQAGSASKGRQMRWHPAIIRWCIVLQSKSTSAYKFIRESGFFKLPHPTTLHPYTHFADPSTGFSADMLETIVKEHNISQCPEQERHVALLFDEMRIKSGLVYSQKLGKIVGYTDVGEISNQVLEFERRCKGDEEPVLATYVLVLMVRGLFSSLQAPVAYYGTEGITSDQLYPCIAEAVIYLETVGFEVDAFVSDGASANRKFYRLQSSAESANPTYFTQHPLDPARRIYFICDVPHLVKTTRNNWENSGYHNKTKNLMYNHQCISWTHLLQLYEWDVGLTRCSPGLRRLHKLSHEHLHLTPALRMRVYMAAQVLSSSVANALESLDRPGTASTVAFIRYMDQFLDCLNVANPHQGRRARKPALEPYTSCDDWRFEWLTKDFLGFFRAWRDEVEAFPGLSKKVKKRMFISKETMEGLEITVQSFVELAKYLLTCRGVSFLLSEKLNQDPLEQYFSRQRGSGGSSDNPSLEQFGHNMLSLHVASGCLKSSKRGNSRSQHDQPADVSSLSKPLPKRK